MAPVFFALFLTIFGPDGKPMHNTQAGVLLNHKICMMAADGIKRDFAANAPKDWKIELKCEPKVKGTVGA